MTPSLKELEILARTIWGEARGEGLKGQRAVAHVIMNRVRDGRWPPAIIGVCRQPMQFSCWNMSGEQSQRAECTAVHTDLLVKTGCYTAAVIVATDYDQDDITAGANHYLTTELLHSSKSPSWADPNKVTVAVGNHTFLRL